MKKNVFRMGVAIIAAGFIIKKVKKLYDEENISTEDDDNEVLDIETKIE